MQEKILLVEDDFALAMGTEYALQTEGYHVIREGNVGSARKALEQTSIYTRIYVKDEGKYWSSE
ncbi:MAG: hypothetical protein K2I10_03775 [Lachnospiraceae bacterium]|nr:hypothetical protein [Lachnospiraceae bacterium]